MRCLGIAVLLLALCGCNQDERLVPHTAIQGDRIPLPLTQQLGDPDRGKALFASREGGHCVLCHQVSGLDAPFQGNLGPDLTGVADRLDGAQIRLRLVDYSQVKPGTVMPSYFRTRDLYQVQEAYRDLPVLDAKAIEDLVSYLSTLGDPL